MDALLVDDEISALRTLHGMLNRYFPQINVVGTAISVDEACKMVEKTSPDVVFLDIEMPPLGSGFDVFEKCKDQSFGVIFTTAYPEYAVKAINEVQPWGYLVKPYSIDLLRNAIEAAEQKILEFKSVNNDIPANQSIVIPDARKGNVIVRIQSILFCKADGGTTEIFFEKGKKLDSIVAYRTLKDIEEQLPSFLFCRCHHSFLANMKFIERYERTGRNGIIHLTNGSEVPISVGKMEDFALKFRQYLGLQ